MRHQATFRFRARRSLRLMAATMGRLKPCLTRMRIQSSSTWRSSSRHLSNVLALDQTPRQAGISPKKPSSSLRILYFARFIAASTYSVSMRLISGWSLSLHVAGSKGRCGKLSEPLLAIAMERRWRYTIAHMPRLKAPERREQLMEVASKLFAKMGYEATTTASIADAAGVTEPILYRHFKSKQEMFVAIVKAVSAQTIEHWQELIRDIHDPSQQIRRISAEIPDHMSHL